MDKGFFCKIKKIFIPCELNKYKPRFLGGKFLLYYALVLLILKLAVMPFLFYFPHTAFFADLTKISLFELANASRQNLGFYPLEENQALNEAAYLKAEDMLEKGYFAHYSPEGITPWYWLERSGYDYTAAGENLAVGFLESEQVHRAWMDSPSHKKNILNPNYREMGIAVLRGDFQGGQTALVVQFFGNPKIEQPPIIEAPIIEEPVIEVPQEEQIIEEAEIAEEEEIKEKEVIGGEEVAMEEPPEAPFVAEAVVPAGVIKKTPAFSLFQFMTRDYYNWIQRIIYGSLILIIISLFITVFYDVFVYRKFQIDHKDIVFKAIGFSALWFVLLFLDETIMIELINTQEFMIH
jgi:hypothetical protein